MNSTFRAAVPDLSTSIASRRSNRACHRRVYQALQAYLGGTFVNQFNRFGRQWRGVHAGGRRGRTTPGRRTLLCNNDGNMVPLGADDGAHDIGSSTQRFNLFRAAQITGSAAPGLPARDRRWTLEEVATKAAARDGLRRWTSPIRRRSGSSTAACSCSRSFSFF